jgi:hypothetical protein
MNVNRLQRKFPILLLAAGIAGGVFVSGCASKVRQETVATVNGDTVKVGELRESLGVPAGVFAIPDIPIGRKKEALDQLVTARLLAQEGRSLGIDNTPEFKEILQRNEPQVLVKALMRKEIEAKLKVTNEELKAEIAKVKGSQGISDADAAMRAVKSVSESRIQKIREDLTAAAKKDTGVPDNVALADQDLTMRAMAAYAKKQGVEGSEEYKAMRQEMERSILRDMVVDNVVMKNVEVTDKEVEADFARRTVGFAPAGRKIPADMVAMLKERIRAALLREKGKMAIDAYIAELKKKATITVNDAILPKV